MKDALPPRRDAVLDHLVVGAISLHEGVAALRAHLGVDLAVGGSHPRMGTHNHVARIGDGIFLEVIAIDPEGTPPDRPRWFGLDDPATWARLAERPRLVAWVAGVRDIAALGEAAHAFGESAEMTRGDLTWRITLTPDGNVPGDGVLPALIQWPDGPHPSVRMADPGLRFEALRIAHPEPARIRAALAAVGADGLAQTRAAATPSLAADIRVPDGRIVTLD